MSIFSNWFGKQGFEVYESTSYDITNIGNIVVPEKLSNKNAYLLANSVAEIYFPIDFYADRISKLRFYIATKKDEEVLNTELNRFIDGSLNPLFNNAEMIYNYVFSFLADGNGYNYLSKPTSRKKLTPSTITRWDLLQPDCVDFNEHNNVSLLELSNLNDAVKKAYYNDGSIQRKILNPENLRIHNYGLRRQQNSIVKSEGVLWKANKSIDTLLSVYSARYNVYANNGMAGILAKKQNATGQMQSSLMDGNKRDEIISDIKDRHGLTGNKNLFGVSGVPVEFIKTLATISELMPLEETLEAAIKIASILQIPPVLVPRKDQSTFSNQETAEETVWQNGLLSMSQVVCDNLTKLFGLSEIGYKIMCDTSSVSALVQNESDNEDLITKKLANIEKLQQLNPDVDTKVLTEEISNNYGIQ